MFYNKSSPKTSEESSDADISGVNIDGLLRESAIAEVAEEEEGIIDDKVVEEFPVPDEDIENLYSSLV